MKKILITFFITLLFSSSLLAQNDWIWPKNQKQYKIAREKEAYYKILMLQEKYNQALVELTWLYKNTPTLHESIYINGIKCTENILENALPPTRKNTLQDSTLWMYNQRLEIFDTSANLLNRRAYTAFKFYYKEIEKYPVLKAYFQDIIAYSPMQLESFNMVPYLTFLKLSYQNKLWDIGAEDLQTAHDYLYKILDNEEKKGGKVDKFKEKIDQIILSNPKFISCDFIEKWLVVGLKSKENEKTLAQKLYQFTTQSECKRKDWEIAALKIFVKYDPNIQDLKNLGDALVEVDKAGESLSYYEQAQTFAKNDKEKQSLHFQKAKSHYILKQFLEAKAEADCVLLYQPQSKEIVEFIGDIYFASFQYCAQQNSIVKDRLVYIAAYEMYKKAKNSEKMEWARSQFPSKEEIFKEGYEVNQRLDLPCWNLVDLPLMYR